MLGGGYLGSQKVLEAMPYKEQLETSLVVQWLRFWAGGMGSIPGQGPKTLHTVELQKQTNKQKNNNS